MVTALAPAAPATAVPVRANRSPPRLPATSLERRGALAWGAEPELLARAERPVEEGEGQIEGRPGALYRAQAGPELCQQWEWIEAAAGLLTSQRTIASTGTDGGGPQWAAGASIARQPAGELTGELRLAHATLTEEHEHVAQRPGVDLACIHDPGAGQRAAKRLGLGHPVHE